MRVFAAILAVVVGGSEALAQGDPRANPAPRRARSGQRRPTKVREGKPGPRPKPEPRSKAAAAKAEPAPNGHQGGQDPPPPAARPPARPPLKPSGLQDTYAAIPAADRAAIQNDLTWGGDFAGPIDGEFSERLVAAVKAYQTRHKNPVTGVMSADERTALAAAVEPRKREVGWRLAEDPVTGARVGLPGKLATKVTALPNGTRWASEQGQLQIETFRIDTGATLDAVFEQQKKMPRRRVESSALQADSFVITGMQGLKKMVVRATARNGEVRGLTILYDQAMEGTVDPLVAPMSSAFVPFPSGFTLAGGAGAPRRKVEYGTGVFVSAIGHVLTDRSLLDGCNVIALPGLGNAERVATDASGELALLRVYGARNLTPIGMIGNAALSGPSVTLVGVADPQTQGGGARRSAVSAQAGGSAPPRNAGRSKPRRRWASPAPRPSMRKAASPAWWC